MEFRDIIYTKDNEGVATITLNRPQTLNALTDRMRDEWVAAIEDAKADDNVRVLVVTGIGRAFCSGANPRELDRRIQDDSESTGIRRTGRWDIPEALAEFDKPYIGAINGPAAGGGMDLASMCDIRIASDQARFGMRYIRMGTTPGMAGGYFLPRIIGNARACELIWTGRMIDAEEALRIGYVSKVVPHDQLMPATREFALQLAKGPAVAIRLSKRLIYDCWDMGLKQALKAHDEAQAITRATEDAKEGPRAWVEKREPNFKGR